MHQPAGRRPARQVAAALHLRANSQRERGSVLDDVQLLVVEASMGSIDGIVEVQALEEHADVTVDVVAGAEVHFGRRVHERRLRAESTASVGLPELLQLIAAPVDRYARLESIALVEPDEVGLVGQSRYRELLRERVTVVRRVRSDERPVDLEAEAPRQHLLPAGFYATDVGLRPIYVGRVRPLSKLARGGIDHTIDRRFDRLIDRELRDMLEERIDGHVVVARVIPLRAQIEVVREVRQQPWVVVARREGADA